MSRSARLKEHPMLKKGYWRSSSAQWPQPLREPSYLNEDAIEAKSVSMSTFIAERRINDTPRTRNSLMGPAAVILSSAILAACAVGPDYHEPKVATPDQFVSVEQTQASTAELEQD